MDDEWKATGGRISSPSISQTSTWVIVAAACSSDGKRRASCCSAMASDCSKPSPRVTVSGIAM
eukprot:5995873-Prymnesium_polylepis.1